MRMLGIVGKGVRELGVWECSPTRRSRMTLGVGGVEYEGLVGSNRRLVYRMSSRRTERRYLATVG